MGRPPKNALQTAAFSMKNKKSSTNQLMEVVEPEKEEKETEQTEKKKMSVEQLRKLLNKKVGSPVAFNLSNCGDENPSYIKEWFSTGCHILDAIICRGRLAGCPSNRVTVLGGVESSGKSYLAGMIAKSAQDQGKTVVYFDSESSIDSSFLEKMGCNLDKLIYVHATTVEQTMEMIESLMGSGSDFLFIIDSITMLPCQAEVSGNFDPTSGMAIKPRILSRAFSKLTQPLAKNNSTMLVCAQLKTNISSNVYDMKSEPFFMPAGAALRFASSLSIWLVPRKKVDTRVTDDNGFIIGSEVKAILKKSRFGTQYRECSFKILWGGDKIAIDESEFWYDIIAESDMCEKRGNFYCVRTDEGEVSFSKNTFVDKLNDPVFKKRILEIVDDQLITKFDKRSGNAKLYYDIDNDEDSDPQTEE